MAPESPIEVAQRSITVILKDNPGTSSLRPQRLSEEQVNRISELLAEAEADAWSKIPRIYAVLHMINKVHVIDAFIAAGISDLWIPFAQRTLPDGAWTASDRHTFLEVQDLVLTKALDLEREDGKHCHFAKSDDIPLKKLAELGKGGFGRVDRVLSTITHREYARKRILRGKTFRNNAGVLRDFERELAHLKKLRHEHIVQLVGSYSDLRFVCILTSPVADSNLKQFLIREGLTIEQKSLLRTFYGCLATAIQYLHENKVRHKDIKPQNILIKGHQVFLTDFGIALDWAELGQSTTTGESLKTERYCAPEVAQNLRRNDSSDLWSLGCVFLEIWTILKGDTLQNLERYLAESGSETQCYHSNIEGLAAWNLKLRRRAETADEDPPLDWIEGMLQIDPAFRWSAQKLAACISDIDDHQHLSFLGDCCLVDDALTPSETASERSSAILDETGASIVNVYQPPLRAVQPTLNPHKPLRENRYAGGSCSADVPQHEKLEVDMAGPNLVRTADVSKLHLTTPAESDIWVDGPASSLPSELTETSKGGPHFAAPDQHSTDGQQSSNLATSTSLSRVDETRIWTPSTKVDPAHRLSDEDKARTRGPEKLYWTPSHVHNSVPSPRLEPNLTHLGTVRQISSSPAAARDTMRPLGPNDKPSSQGNLSRDEYIAPTEASRHNISVGRTSHSWLLDGLRRDLEQLQTASAAETPARVTELFNHRESPSRNTQNPPARPARLPRSDDDSQITLDEPYNLSVHPVSSSNTLSRQNVSRNTTNDETPVDWEKCLILRGHQDAVLSVAISPEGKMIVSGSMDGTIRLWNIATGQCQNILSGHREPARSVTFSPDGKTIASGSIDATIRLWDTATALCRITLAGHQSPVWSVAFSPDGTMIASCSTDKTIKLWDIAAGTCLYTLSGHFGSVYTVNFSPDGTKIASGSTDKTVKLWDLATGLCQYTLFGHTGSVYTVSFSPDGTMIASGSTDKTIKLWDLAMGMHLYTLSGHISAVYTASFSPNGMMIASGSEDRTIRLWDLATGLCSYTLSGRIGPVYTVSFSPDGRNIASASSDRTVGLWGSPLGQGQNKISWEDRNNIETARNT